MNKQTMQFPLALLAYEKTKEKRLSAAISYAVVTTGLHRLKTLSSGEVEAELQDIKILPRSGGHTREQVTALALGDKFCGVTHRSAKFAYGLFQAVESFLQNWRARGLTTPWARVPADMVWEAMKGSAETYQRFATLSACCAIIGSKTFAVVTRPRVRAGILGYSSGSLLFDDAGALHARGRALLAERDDPQPTIPTDRQIRTMLANLVKSQLLHVFYPGSGRSAYYSKFLHAEQIAQSLIRRAERTANNPKLDALRERLRKTKQALLSGQKAETCPLNSESPLNGKASTTSPEGVQSASTRRPLNASSYAALNASPNASAYGGARPPVSEGKPEEAGKPKPVDQEAPAAPPAANIDPPHVETPKEKRQRENRQALGIST